jgi:hypothetical protein
MLVLYIVHLSMSICSPHCDDSAQINLPLGIYGRVSCKDAIYCYSFKIRRQLLRGRLYLISQVACIADGCEIESVNLDYIMGVNENLPCPSSNTAAIRTICL